MNERERRLQHLEICGLKTLGYIFLGILICLAFELFGWLGAVLTYFAGFFSIETYAHRIKRQYEERDCLGD